MVLQFGSPLEWCLGPIPRDSDLIGMGCGLAIGVFFKVLEVNLTCSKVLEPLLDTVLSKTVIALCYMKPRISGRHLLAQCEPFWPYPLPGGMIPTHWLWGSFLPLNFTLALKSECNSEKVRTPNDNTETGFIRVGSAVGDFTVCWWIKKYPNLFHLDCVLL